MRAVVAVFLAAIAGAVHAAPAQAAFVANLQLVSYCDNDGSQCADAQLDQSLFNTIWAQADLTFTFLPIIEVNNTNVATIADFPTALSLHTNTVTGLLGGPLPFTLYLGVGRDNTDPSSTIGLSFLGAPFGIIDGSITSADLFFRTVNAAHQVGHMLGLRHNGDGNSLPPTGLMSPFSDPNVTNDASVYTLFEANIEIVQQSSLITTQAIPAPATLSLFAVGLLGLTAFKRRRLTARHHVQPAKT